MFQLFLQAQPASSGSGGGVMQIVMLVGIVAIFYFFMIRPQQKRNKEQKAFRESLQKGQKIITIGGIHGKIIELQDTTVIIEVEGQGRLKMEKSAVAMDNSSQITQ